MKSKPLLCLCQKYVVLLAGKSLRRLSEFLNEFLVFHLWRIDESSQCISKQIWILSSIEAPLELIEVRLKVLSRNLVKRADQRTLKQAPNALNAVCVDIA